MTTRPKPHSGFDDGHNSAVRRSRGSREYTSEPKHDHQENPSGQHHNHLPMHLPHYHPNGYKKTKGIHINGESGRSGFHPLKFLMIIFRSASKISMAVNVLWPFVPAAIAVHFIYSNELEPPEETTPERYHEHLIVFILNYIAMIPSANLIGFAGQELARKLPKVAGVVLETSLGSITEIVLFVALVAQRSFPGVIRSAILGSILANLLLALGACFIAGGFKREEQVFHEAVSEVGSGLMLVAGFGLIVPAAFTTVFTNTYEASEKGTQSSKDVIHISRATAICLLVAFIVYLIFQTTSHHNLYAEVLEADEQRDKDRHKDIRKEKLTFTECIVALLIAITCTALIAVFLVLEIPYFVEARIGQEHGNVTEAFMGLILVPLVEKFAEHLTAIDEAYDNQANFALTHVLGSSIQTALLNTPIVVFVGWGMANYDVDLNFRSFEAIVLILAIIVVGNFLRDGKSNYLEGALCVIVYIIIAICAFYLPNPGEPGTDGRPDTAPPDADGSQPGAEGQEAASVLIAGAAKLMARS